MLNGWLKISMGCLLIVLPGIVQAGQKAKPVKLKVYFSNDFQGYLEPCG